MNDPRKYFRNNVVNILNLLNAMVQAGVKNIVFSSSCATYGIPQNGLIEESHPQSPVNPALLASARRANQLLKWQPFYPEIDCIIETAWKWHANRSRLSHAVAGR